MKNIGKVLTIILLGAILLTPLMSCGSQPSAAEAADSRTATVTRGNLSVEINAAGNLALSRTEDLAFEVAGTVEDISVSEGDAVTEGQELARLDTSEWDKQLKTLEKTLTTAQRSVTTRETALTSAERSLLTLQRTVTTKEKAVTTAQRTVTSKQTAVDQESLDLETAQYNLSQIADVKKIQDQIDNAEFAMKFAKNMLSGEFGDGVQLTDYSYWSNLAADAKAEMEQAQDDLADLLADRNITVSTTVRLQIARYQLAVTTAEQSLGDARIAVEDALTSVTDAQRAVEDARLDVQDGEQSVENARLSLADAQQSVTDAQSDLDEARSLSPVVVAPFDGFVTRVNVAGGDEVFKGTVAVQIADPNKFEAEILVSEMDIMQVSLNERATVEVNALSGLTLPATVTHIAPTATIQSGVVNYKVTVEVQASDSLRPNASANSDNTTAPTAGTALPDRIQQAIDAGRMTREQAQAFLGRAGGTGATARPSAIPQNVQLREGLTVTVNVITQQSNNVLLVPNSAIIRQGNQNYVTVKNGSTTEQRPVQTGISDWQHTEITGGLTEGEIIVIPQGTTAAATTGTNQQGQRPPGGGLIPGMRIIR
ncbi:MAG: HlyD family efflux transporter periplasmic adaptor subunit [Chloroflexota bacterium]